MQPSFYADFSGTNDQDRTRLMVEDTSKFDSQITGGSGTGAFTVTMMMRDLAIVGAGNSQDGLFWGERFSGGVWVDLTQVGSATVSGHLDRLTHPRSGLWRFIPKEQPEGQLR